MPFKRKSYKPYKKRFRGAKRPRKVETIKSFGVKARALSSSFAQLRNIYKSPVTIQEGYLPFNSAGLYRLPYVENFHIQADGTTKLTTGTYSYNLTGPYDPRIEVLGGQPLQWDQVIPMYERYWVHKAKVTVTFSNPTADGAVCGVRVRGSTNPVNGYSKTLVDIMEMDCVKMSPVNNTGSQKKTFSFDVYPRQILGITKGQYNNIEYSAQYNTVPNVNVILEPWLVANANSTDNITMTCYVKIIYYIQMTNKVTVLDA